MAMSGPMLRKIALWSALSAVLVYLGGELYRTRDHREIFRADKGNLETVRETLIEDGPLGAVTLIELRNDRGLAVRAHLRIPASRAAPRPLLLILGGMGTDKQTLDRIPRSGEFALLALEYPYHGKKRRLSALEFLGALPAMRRAIVDTVPAGMLAVDYALRRPDIDPKRIVVAGGSLGALFAPALGATDERIAAVGVFFGAGDIERLAHSNLSRVWEPVRSVAGWLVGTLASPVEPLKYIGRIAPRPVFLLNGAVDERMPAALGQRLQDAANPPKTVRWLPVGHVNIRAPEFHAQILDEFTGWLVEIGMTNE